MKRSLIRQSVVGAGVDDLLGTLSTAQYLNPHEPLAQALGRTADALGVCPHAIDHAVAWLGVNPATPVGRLRRTELMQLARSIHRFWEQAAAAATATPATPTAGAVVQPSERPS